MRTHIGERPFSCRACHKTFTRQHENRHERLHKEPRCNRRKRLYKEQKTPVCQGSLDLYEKTDHGRNLSMDNSPGQQSIVGNDLGFAQLQPERGQGQKQSIPLQTPDMLTLPDQNLSYSYLLDGYVQSHLLMESTDNDIPSLSVVSEDTERYRPLDADVICRSSDLRNVFPQSK